MNVAAILARWDRIAFAQLCEHVAGLADERDEYRERAYHAEENADAWRDDCLQIMQESGQRLGLTVDGRMVAVPPENVGAVSETLATALRELAHIDDSSTPVHPTRRRLAMTAAVEALNVYDASRNRSTLPQGGPTGA